MKLLKKWITGTAMLMLFALSISAQSQRLDKKDQSAIINKATGLLVENYIFPARIPVIEKTIKDKLKTGGYNSFNDMETFLEALNNDLERSGNDHHLDIFYGPDRVKQIIADTKNDKSGKEETFTKKWLEQMQYENFRLRKVERLDGNIGYFNILNFTPLAPTKQTLVSAMNFLLYSSAIIIDLRDNGGGNAETMNFMLSYFLKDSVEISELRRKGENTAIKIFTTEDSMINKIPENIPLYIIVSNRTSSAAEGFAYTLQQYRRATIVGEQTKGEGSPGRLFVVNDSLYMMIPTAEATYAVSKKSFDGIGVTPDIKVEKDKALTRALIEVNTLLASRTNDRELKLLYQWQLPFLENQLDPHPITENIIASLIGNYEDGRKIVYENATIFYVTSKGKKEKLEYIGNGTFQLIGKNSLRLVMPFTDKPIPSFTWIWDDGGEPEQVKRVVKDNHIFCWSNLKSIQLQR